MAGKQVANIPDTMLPGMVDDLARRKLLDSFHVSVEGRMVYANRLPSPGERRELQSWNADLVKALRPASMSVAECEEAKRNLSALFLGYNQMRYEGDGITDIVNAYLLVLQKYPLFAIVRAIDDVASNRIAGLDPNRPPTSPRMGKIASDHVAVLATHQLKIGHVLSAKALLQANKTMAGKARVLAALKDFHDKVTPAGTIQDGGMLTEEERTRMRADQRRANEVAMRKEWAHFGLEPRYQSDGVMLSPKMAVLTGAIVGAEAAVIRGK